MNKILDYFDLLIPNPVCELDYTKDYELLIAVMLSAQTTDKRVNMVTSVLFKEYPTILDLKNADVNRIKDIIKSVGTYNKKASNIIEIADSLISNFNGVVPNNREYLEALPGVGRKTTNVVLSILYNEQCIAVDTHVARISIRLGLANTGDDVLTIEKKLTKMFSKYQLSRVHHQMLLFGRYYCKSKNPLCEDCKLIDICKYNKTIKKI